MSLFEGSLDDRKVKEEDEMFAAPGDEGDVDDDGKRVLSEGFSAVCVERGNLISPGLVCDAHQLICQRMFLR